MESCKYANSELIRVEIFHFRSPKLEVDQNKS